MVEITIDYDKCVGCGDCVFLCPVKVYEIEEKKAIAKDSESCCGGTCNICVTYCWRDAIVHEYK
jgi:NAD-dependent dihydropyrimidine dehydrogenase PreA subunit